MAIEKIKISQLTPTNTKGLVIASVYEGGAWKTYSYDLNNITGVVKGSEFAGFVPCSSYIGAYIKPFISQGGAFDPTDKFFFLLKGSGICGFWDDNDQAVTFTQLGQQTTLVYWDGSQYNSEIIADSTITPLTETNKPHFVPSAYQALGVEVQEKFDMGRYPICVKTWSEFVDAMQMQQDYINIYVSEDITADNTNPTQIDIHEDTKAISISGCQINDVVNLVLSSLNRTNAFRLDVNNHITLKSTYNPMTMTGDKGSLTFNIDKNVVVNVGGEISSSFFALTNSQTYVVNIYGNMTELYGGYHVPSDITGNIVIREAIAGKADKVANASDGEVATLDNSGNLSDSGKFIDIDRDCKVVEFCKLLDLSVADNAVVFDVPAGYVADFRGELGSIANIAYSTQGSDGSDWTTPATVSVTFTNAQTDAETTNTATIANHTANTLSLVPYVKGGTSVSVKVVTPPTGATIPLAMLSGKIYMHKEN